MDKTYSAIQAIITAAIAIRESGIEDQDASIAHLEKVIWNLTYCLREQAIEELRGKEVNPLDLTDEEKEFALTGRKILAIKSYRQRMSDLGLHAGLKESKEKIDRWLDKAKPGQIWDYEGQRWVYRG